MQRTRVAVGQGAVGLENHLAREWRVTRLTGLGIPGRWPGPAGTTWTGARSPGLVRRGCPPDARPG